MKKVIVTKKLNIKTKGLKEVFTPVETKETNKKVQPADNKKK
jgi:hypothetical protein